MRPFFKNSSKKQNTATTTNDSMLKFHQMNAGAHRKTATRVHAPALTCHLGIWTHTDADLSHSIRMIDKSIIKTILKLRSYKIPTESIVINNRVGNHIFLFESCYNSTDLSIDDTSVFTNRIKEISQSNYRIILVDAPLKDWHLTFRYELHTEYMTITLIIKRSENPVKNEINAELIAIENDLEKKLADVSSYLKGKVCSFKPTEEAGDLYAIWDLILNKFIAEDIEDLKIGEIFADFRGAVISDETITFRDQRPWDEQTKTVPTWGDNSVVKLQDIISDRHKHEITASYMLHGRALYLTNLGPQSMDFPDNKRIPTKFIIYAHQKDLSHLEVPIVNNWQLGRLIDKLHLLGTLRLAAIKNLSELRQASKILAGMDRIKKEAAESKKGKTLTDSKLPQFLHRSIKLYMDNIPNDIVGGIQYRIERSRYYSSNFRKGIGMLRIVRVEGYQPYDEFIERRLGSTFDFIDKLGIRYERALDNISRLQSDSIAFELKEIQSFGEMLLLLALAPYYICHLLEDTGAFLQFKEYLTASVWIAFISIYLFRQYFGVNKIVRGVSALAFYLAMMTALTLWTSTFSRQIDWNKLELYLSQYISTATIRIKDAPHADEHEKND